MIGRVLLTCWFLLAGACAAGAFELSVEGAPTQGGLVYGHAEPGAVVTLDGKPVRMAAGGDFVVGFGRDHGPQAVLVAKKDGIEVQQTLTIAQRTYDIQRIDGLPERMVTPPPDVLARIKRENEAIAAARATDSDGAWFRGPFAWPAAGRISGVYGSQRILNGKPRQPHLGLDIAAPAGTPVFESAGGRIVLAEPDLYYTGGTIVVDHGLGLSSVYSHLQSVAVKVGDVVARGQRIGSVGATGRATGPHLDWRIDWYGERLDPALIVDGPMPKAEAASGD